MFRFLVLITFILIGPLLWASDLPQFGTDVPHSLKHFLSKALLEMFQIEDAKQSSSLHQKVFSGPVSGLVYKRWFLKRVKKISMTDSCAVTAKIDSQGPPGVIYISKCVNFEPEEELKFYWLSVLFHEARHLESENNHWKHDICLDHGGHVQACDSSAIGAFGIEKILALNVSRFCQSCHPEFLRQAQEVYEDSKVWNKLNRQALEPLQLDLEVLEKK